MYCDQCGAQLQDQQSFCHSCGKSFAPPAIPARRGRVAGNLRVLGILWIVYSVVHLVPAFFLAAVLPAGVPWAHSAAFRGDVIFGSFFGLLGGFLLIAALLGIIAGWGLLERKLWARTMAIVFGCIALLNIPFGTALGIYTLWVLASSESDREYRATA